MGGVRAWTAEPFRVGTAEQFKQLRELLVRTGFEEMPLCARAAAESIYDFPRGNDRRTLKDLADPLSLLVMLFIDGDEIPRDAIQAAFASPDTAVFDALGLLHPSPNDPERCKASIAIYPQEELFIVADRRNDFESTGDVPPSDLVFLPTTRETRRFLRLMPREPCDDLLELCAGTGVAGLVAASHFARRVTLVDIAERSARFASFNVALNDLDNVRVLQGDLYRPVTGEQFDVIIAHPPYVPALETEFVFRDAGEDGEQVTRRIVAEAGEHLKPGGQLFCECMLTERQGASLDQRLRGMLGEWNDEFDVVIVQGRSLDPLHFFTDQAKAGYATFDRLGTISQTLTTLRIQQLVFCSVLLQRRATDRPVITTRRVLSPLTGSADLQWVLRWMVGTAGWDMAESRRLLTSRPRTLPRTELRSRSMLHDGQWAVDECQLVTMAPFAVEATCPNWYATLLQFCDGRMTARDHLQYLRDTHAVPDTAPEDVFAMMIRQLVDAGLVEIDEFRLPDATAMREGETVRERAAESGPVERAD